MRDVSVIGAAMIRFGKYPQATLADLAQPAVREALADAGVERQAIQAAYCGTALGGMLAGQRVLKTMGMTSIPIVNVENACSSSASAFREAWAAIGSGLHDVVLVIGVEKLTKFGGGTLPLEEEDWEVGHGMTMPALYAMRASRYMHEYELTVEQLAQVAVKAKAHAAHNPYAQIRKTVTVEEVLNSRPVAEPLTLFQCCPTGDGAAALVLCASEIAPRYLGKPVRVLASELASGKYISGYRDMTTPEITVRGAAEAYELAGLGPEDIDVAEVHDAFTIAELMYYEALGFCERGEAARLLSEGTTSLGGRIPVNPSGGLLSKGHPIGATGAAQMVEIVWQLRGQCGPRQVEGARVGLTHATGGGISGLDHGACAIHIFASS
jgi:benzoylsuccinyl-CoA thiolase BbsB subunit